MGFEIPYSEDEINQASNKIISTQKVENGYVRPVAWRGSEMMAISAQQTKIHVAIATWEWGSYFDPKLKVEGIKLNISKLEKTRTQHYSMGYKSIWTLYDLYTFKT